MTFAEYALSRIHNKKTNILLKSGGGTGKTYSLLEAYDLLFNDPYFGKTCYAPVFIPFKDLSDKSLKQLILDNSNLVPSTKDDVSSQYEMLSRKVFNSGNEGYHTVLFLDGANEANMSDSTTRVVRELSDSENLSVIVSSRVDLPSPFDWSDFDVVSLAPVDEETIDEYAPDAEGKLRELLKIPFYLELYLRSEKDPELKDTINAYSFLDVFFKNSGNKIVDPIGNSSDYELILKILAEIVFIKSKNKYLSFSLNDSEVAKIHTKYGVDRDRFTSLLQLLVNLNVVARKDEYRYEITHEIYRDYLAARHFIRCTKEYVLVADDTFQTSSESIFNEFVSQGLFNKEKCTDFFSGEVFITREDLENTFFAETESPERILTSVGNLDFLLYDLKERFSNGTQSKVCFSKNMSEVLDRVWKRIKSAIDQTEKSSVHFIVIDYIESYAELLRRASSFDRGRSILGYLDVFGEEYANVKKHGIAKYDLYESFASIGKSDSSDTYALLEKTLDTLSENHYSLSLNLYAFILSTPVLSIEQSVEDYVKNRGLNRYQAAADAYWESARLAFGRKRDQGERYPLQQLVWMILHGKIGVTSDEPVYDKNTYLADDSVHFSQEPQYILSEESFHFSDVMLRDLLRARETENFHLMRALYFIYKDGINNNTEQIKSELSEAGQRILARFIRLLYDGREADINELQKLTDSLSEMSGRSLPDSDHPVYTVRDMIDMHERFVEQGFSYTAEFTGSMDKLKSLFDRK